MNQMTVWVAACVFAASLACRLGTAGVPVGGPDGRGTAKGAPTAQKKIAFQVKGLMKTKSGAT